MESIFAEIAAAEHSTVAWLEKELAKLVGEAPTIEKVIDSGLTYITPVLQIALSSLGDPAAAAVVGTVVTEAQSDLLAASALVTDFGPTPTAASIFASVKANLAALLTAGHVKSSTSVSAVNKAVSEIGLLGTAVQTAADKLASPPPAVTE